MSWFDEIPHLFRNSMSVIGFVFYVREKMHNSLQCDEDELRLTLGPEWKETIDTLKKSGVLKVSRSDKIYTMSVVAPGDKKRSRCREIGRRKSAMNSFEYLINNKGQK